MKPVNMAAKEAHDEELEKMEAEIAAQAANPNPAPTEPVAPSASEEEPTPAPSAEGEEKQPVSEKPEATPPAQPDGGKPEGDYEELSDEEVQKLSEKAQKRFKSLAAQNLRVKQENEFLRKHMKSAEQPEPPKPAPTKLPWETQEEEGTEDPAIIARREALAVIAEEKRQDAIVSNLRSDSEYIEQTYAELNPQSEKYDPTLVTKISVWYKGMFKDNNDLRLKDFVTELMSLRATGIDQGRSEVTEKVVKQAAQQAIISNAPATPPASSVQQKIAGAKSMAELEALEAQL